jgi:hypothetical protein
MPSIRYLVALTIAGLVCAAASAGDTVENADYKSWSKFKPGASVTMKIKGESKKDGSTEGQITTKLLEVAPDKLVLEMSLKLKTPVGDVADSGRKREVLKIITPPPGVSKQEYEKSPYGQVLEEGAETLKISGVEYKCKWYRTQKDDVEAKIWLSDLVPGAVVKSVINSRGASPKTMKLELVDLKKP